MSARPITVADLELFYTGLYTSPFTIPADLYDMIEIQKALGTIETTTTGVLNRVFGALVWSQLNLEANWFGMLPKTTWVRSGWRVWTGLSRTDPTTIAISETGALPSPSYPDIKMIYTAAKTMTETYEVSDVLEALSTVSADDVWGQSVQARMLIGTEFVRLVNKALGAKVAEAASAWTPFEKIDRIVSKSGEQGFTAGWEDVYGIDRSVDTWANSYVDDSASLRPLTYDLIVRMLSETRKRGANTNVFVTGYDTFAVLSTLFMNFVRYLPMGETQVSFGVNGVQTAEGINAGIRVASINGIPVIQTQDIPVGSGSGEVGYIYALDTTDTEGYGLPRLAFSLLRPLEYFETREFLLLNKFVVKGAFRIVGETVARYLPGQGKIRDITS